MVQCINCEESFTNLLSYYGHLMEVHNMPPDEAFRTAWDSRTNNEHKNKKIDETEKLVG